MKRALATTFLSLLACLLVLAAGRGASPDLGGLPGDPIEGGRIFDNWILALDLAPPAGDHPLWDNQDNNTRSGVITWRCVECHGWDYKGAAGAYGPYSSHYTGFRGVESAIGATQDEVLDRLNGTFDPDHDFLRYTNSTALDDLAAFLRTQQIDMNLIIDPFTGQALGDRQLGALIYFDSCSSCHGANGDAINFGDLVEPLFLGDLAVGDPWQTVHKIRFGSTSTAQMPSSEKMGWSLSRVADVLAYAQSLRQANPDLNIISADPNATLDTETQGQIEPIIWGAFILIAVVFVNVALDTYNSSGLKTKVSRFRKSRSKK